MIQVLFLILFFALESSVFVENVYAECVVTTNETDMECKSVPMLPGMDFKVYIKHYKTVKRLYVRNNGSQLILYSHSFRYLWYLEHILIERSQIQELYTSIFSGLPLRTIIIQNNDIEKIQPGVFLNLSSLLELSVINDHLKTIPRGVFNDLPKLNTLTLSKNEISSIEDSALENLPQLSKLHMDNNRIEEISIHKIVSHPEQLEILWIQNNSLTNITNFMLQKLTKLKLLNVGFNKISVIETNAFEQTPLLGTLVLTNNKLKELDRNIFPNTGLNNLEKLYLENNELMFLSSNLFFRLHSLRRITLVGNPWMCTCLDFIYRVLAENEIIEKCQDEYVTGQRPICVNEDVTSRVCSNKYDEKLSEIYLNYRRMFPVYIDPISCIL